MNLTRYLFSNQCFLCQKESNKLIGGVCSKCSDLLPTTVKYFHNLYYFLDYKLEKDYFILQAKQYNKPVYLKRFTSFCGELLQKQNMKKGIVTYVPIHNKIAGKRGFNQSEVIAKVLAKKLDMPCVKLLKKTKQTAFQKELHVKERKKNLIGVFSRINKFISSELIYLVDDITTTGSTLKECEKVLLSTGFKKVMFITLARVKK
ncbi:MAG: ComF family protein [Clostridiales bacterium]|nr:ComF family protein [Clostridiales bacterium]